MAKPVALFERLDDKRLVDEFLTMESWLNDNMPVPGEVFREFVKYLYQQNLLVQNRMPVGRRIVDLKHITCPVLNLMAVQDNLVPAAQSEPFNDLVGSTDREGDQALDRPHRPGDGLGGAARAVAAGHGLAGRAVGSES